MKFRIQVLRVADDGAERMKEVMEFERQELAMETLGMSLAEGKAVLKGVQEFAAEQQAAEFLQRERTCRHCARHLSSKGAGSTSVRTVFGTVRLPNPRWNQCDCQSTGKGSFRPLQGRLCGQTTPELLYLEVRWASLIPYGGVARLLEDVLPVAYMCHASVFRGNGADSAAHYFVGAGTWGTG
jgi:hypothetical protein